MAKEGIDEQLRGVLNCLADVFERSGVWKRRDLPKACEVCPIYGICLKLRKVIGEQESAFRELAR